MHSEDGEADLDREAATYGYWSILAGFGLAGGLILFMFVLADGFA